jgi:hypothetical protein
MCGLIALSLRPAAMVSLNSSSFADAFAEARYHRWVHRRFMHEVLVTAEALPVRILHPGFHHILVSEVKGIFQVVQRNQLP